MDANGKAPKTGGDIGLMKNEVTPSDVIINIAGDEKDSKFSVVGASTDQKHELLVDSAHSLSYDLPLSAQKAGPASCRSPETAMVNSNANKPPKIPAKTLTRRMTFSKSVYSRSKSRFGEQPVFIDTNVFEENGSSGHENVNIYQCSPNTKIDTNSSSNKESIKMVSMSRTISTNPLAGDLVGVDEHEEIYNRVSSRKKLNYRKVKVKVLIEWLLFLFVLGFLIACLTVNELHNWKLWELEIWKWCVLVLVAFNGMLVTKWLIQFVVVLIELNYLLKNKVLYFVYALKKSVQVCIWLSLVLITWVLLFEEGIPRSHLAKQILHYITWTIASLLIGAFLWLLKTLLLKILASSFHVNTFFDRIQESIFHQYILFTLSGPPVMESTSTLGKTSSNLSQLSFHVTKKGKGGKERKKEVIGINKIHQMKKEKVSALTMKMLVDMISNSSLVTLPSAIDESIYDEDNEKMDKEITNEEEAIAAAYYIFRNVAQHGCQYIDEEDLGRFMIKEEVDLVFPIIDAAETGQIDRKALTDWVVKVYKGRKALAHALNDTKTAVKQLNKLVTGILIVIVVIIWLLLTGIATTKVVVFLSSQIVLAVFIFGNTCKMVFEAIIFVFVMHPFDVGDRCVIDGVQMIVEEMNILNTVFLKFDNEKTYYPNSVLATKPISNFYRSPDMGDSLEFCIDFKTPLDKIGSLKEKIKKYLEKNPQQWHPNHNVVVKEIENVNKIKMALFFNHTINFQDFAEKSRRKTELVLEMKKIFEDLNIRYDLLPQQVHLSS